MRHVARFAMLGALASAALFATALAPAAQASFGIEKFEAGTCLVDSCTYASPNSVFYTQAAGHPPSGITLFELNHSGANVEGSPLKRIRVDVPPGLAADPVALPTCKRTQFEANACPASTQVGTTELDAVADEILTLDGLPGKVFNLETPPGLPLDFGINVEATGGLTAPVQLYLEGHVDWSGDYHEYFEINNVPEEANVELIAHSGIGVKAKLKVLMSKLNFNGRAGQGNFLTIPSVCSSTTTSHLELESYAGELSTTETHTPVGVEGCDKVPFKPTATVSPETSQSDTPDGATTVVKVPQNVGAEDINTADIQDAHVTLPEGLTLNPAAAHGLEACTATQIGIGTRNPISCPAGSILGTVALETDLPPGSLTGNVYLGSPSGGLITDPPFTIYLVAQNTNLDVSVRLRGLVTPNPITGRLEVTFADNPQLPFSELRLTLNGGMHAPLANPLVCGAATADSVFTPYTGGAAAITSTSFATTGCPAALPFALGQSTAHSSPNAGAYTSYTFNLARADGQQYLSQLKTVLPAGLVGAIPSLTLCGEPQAQAGTCTAASQIGVATASVGSGSDPYPFTGPVYLTGPYNGAPYGLSIPINAAAGPFSLGPVVTRAAISVDPHTARVIATSSLPTIVKGIPLRLKNLSVVISRSNFLFNPTNCGPLATESTLTSTFGATQSPTQGLSTPFQVANCTALAFKPSFKTSTSAKTSKLNGASLQVNLTQGAHEANMKSVVVSLPKQLPSRLTTLQKACPEATFAANPVNCRALGSEVGTATVATPVLPDKLTGSAYLVSHGGAAFPDLDLVLEGDGGVRVILTGNTNIKGGITTSTFASIPDVPVSSFVLNLPVGPHSALTAIGGLCLKPLLIPTTITGQNGAQVKQNTRISVSGCSVRILSHRVVKHKLIIKVRTLGAGLIKLKGNGLRSASRRVSKSATVTFKLPLTHGGQKALSRAHRRHRKLKINVRVAFTPKQKGQFGSAASAAVTFK
jgi:hypothetical protein